MNPKVVKAWACSYCNKTYPRSDHGKLFASACCKCPTCDEGMSTHLGASRSCPKCCAKKELERAAESLKDAQERLTRARITAKQEGVIT